MSTPKTWRLPTALSGACWPLARPNPSNSHRRSSRHAAGSRCRSHDLWRGRSPRLGTRCLYSSPTWHLPTRWGFRHARWHLACHAPSAAGGRHCARHSRTLPPATFINYANPMSAITRGIRKATGVNVLGLCHGVVHVQAFLAKMVGLPTRETAMTYIGVNHCTWITQFRHQGRNAWPQIDAVLAANPPDQPTSDSSLIGATPFSWNSINSMQPSLPSSTATLPSFTPTSAAKARIMARH